MRATRIATLSSVLALVLAAAAPPVAAQPGRIRLILQITVDQLRGDLPTRYFDRLGEGGLRYLLESGTVYSDAHHAHANNETIVGHTTLATGAHPADHGLISNVWFDRERGKLVYNVEDAGFPLLTTGADVDDATEIDPTQRVATSEGRSPNNILTSTFSDELAAHTNGKAKIFGVSVKDRGAISMAGHAGKAFWFSKAKGEFVTSSYYYERYPDWVVTWNQKAVPRAYANTSWTLLADLARYLFGEDDDQPWETDFPGFGRVFPHPYGGAEGRYFTTLLTLSPAGDEITVDFAKTLLVAEGLGKDDIPDYLAVSFSSTDYVGHIFGPSSLETEDNLLRLDRTLADLLSFVDAEVGLGRTLIVLAADHGAPEVPGYLQSLGLDGGHVDPAQVAAPPGLDALEERFGSSADLIESYFPPYVFLDRDLIRQRELSAAEVEGAIAALIEGVPGVHSVIASHELIEGHPPSTRPREQVFNNHHPIRSGDLYVVVDRNWFIADFDGLSVASNHGSPWSYDSWVPIVFAGAGVPAQTIKRRVQTVAVAPTLAALVGTKPPNGSSGELLNEVFE